ncbi:MAG: glycerol-3-phosphate 1-O-acyltransferase PlsY [Planctomycetota bacterium]|jgi:glycerol-3-phosphate acyltransferase PlsY
MSEFLQNLSLPAWLLVAGSYLLGSIPFGLLIGKAYGVDIREQGSGNIGATNLGRALGKRWAVAAFLLDFSKGILPTLATPYIADWNTGEIHGLAILAGTAAILGHTFPLYLRFRGGKGVATTLGVITGVAPPATLLAGIVWGGVYLMTRTVSISSLATGATLPLGIWATELLYEQTNFSARLFFSIAIAALIFLRHRTNIVRLLKGEELTFKKATGKADTTPDD